METNKYNRCEYAYVVKVWNNGDKDIYCVNADSDHRTCSVDDDVCSECEHFEEFEFVKDEYPTQDEYLKWDI